MHGMHVHKRGMVKDGGSGYNTDQYHIFAPFTAMQQKKILPRAVGIQTWIMVEWNYYPKSIIKLKIHTVY